MLNIFQIFALMSLWIVIFGLMIEHAIHFYKQRSYKIFGLCCASLVLLVITFFKFVF